MGISLKTLVWTPMILISGMVYAEDGVCPWEQACQFQNQGIYRDNQMFCVNEYKTALAEGLDGADVVSLICKSNQDCIQYSMKSAPKTASTFEGPDFKLTGLFCKITNSQKDVMGVTLFNPGKLQLYNKQISVVGDVWLYKQSKKILSFRPGPSEISVQLPLGPYFMGAPLICQINSQMQYWTRDIWLYEGGTLRTCSIDTAHTVKTQYGPAQINSFSLYENGNLRFASLSKGSDISFFSGTELFILRGEIYFHPNGKVRKAYRSEQQKLFSTYFDEEGQVLEENQEYN